VVIQRIFFCASTLAARGHRRRGSIHASHSSLNRLDPPLLHRVDATLCERLLTLYAGAARRTVYRVDGIDADPRRDPPRTWPEAHQEARSIARCRGLRRASREFSCGVMSMFLIDLSRCRLQQFCPRVSVRPSRRGADWNRPSKYGSDTAVHDKVTGPDVLAQASVIRRRPE